MTAPRDISSVVALVLVGAWLSLAGCVTQLGAGTSEFDDDPRQTLPEPRPVDVTIEGLGLDGYVSHDNPTVIDYRLRNRGPARKVVLELHEWPPPEHVPWSMTVTANTPPHAVELAAGQERAGQWIIPQLYGFPSMHGSAESELLVLARGDRGELLGAAELPDVKQAYGPVAVIAADADTGLAIQQSVHRADLGQGAFGTRREVALLLDDPPVLWYELGATSSVVLARRWSELQRESQLALRRHVAFGGTLHVLPEHCPDWRSAAPARDATPGLLPGRYGGGRVYVEPVHSGAAGERETWLARTLPAPDRAVPGWNAINPPLTLAYVMPDTALLVLLILLIVALVGPTAHLVLVRLRRREWSWVAIPALSLLLAGCMYAVASGVKGEISALEVHYLVQSFGDAQDAAVSAAIRIQSAEAGRRTVRIRGGQPRPSQVSFAPFGAELDARQVQVTADRFAIGDIPMHRFSSHDLGVTFPDRSRRVRVEQLGEDGVRVINETGAALTDLYLERPAGWVHLAARLGPGAKLERRNLGSGTPEYELFDDRQDDLEALHLSGVLGAAIGRRQTGSVNDFALVAGCSSRGLPEVELWPAPSVRRVRATCAWLITPPEDAATGGQP